MEQIGQHRKITVLVCGIPPFQGFLPSPGLPAAQMSTLERKCKSLCPGMAINMLCDLSKIISRPQLALSFPACTWQEVGLLFSNCELWPT